MAHLLYAALAKETEAFLLDEAKDKGFLDKADKDAVLDWLELADICGFEELMRWCIAATVCNWKVKDVHQSTS